MRGSVPLSPAVRHRSYRVSRNYLRYIYIIIIASVAGIATIILHDQSVLAFVAIVTIVALAYFGVFCFSTQFIIYDDRIIKKNILGERCLYRDDIQTVEIRHKGDGFKVTYLIPKIFGQDEMALPAYLIEFDSKFHEWIFSIIENDIDLLEEYRKTYR